ncbi:hypothetical protein L7F22_044709 [Adiantum nelumboides]|nr:hypothetical protein [Adiantum nelumboides]
MFINDSYRSGFFGASIHENAHVNSCIYRPSCSLAAIGYPEVSYVRYTDVPAHPYGRNVEPNTSYLEEGAKLLHADTVTWNTNAYQFSIHHELTSLEISELTSITKGQSFASRLATDKTGNNVAMSDSEEPALHPKFDDHLSRSITITKAEQSSIDDLFSTLTKCRQLKDPLLARVTYLQTCCLGLDDHIELGNHLIPMFVDCGSLSVGHRVFNKLIMQNEHSWTSLIQGSIEWGDWKHASKLYEEMKGFLVHPSSFTFVALLKGCAIDRLVESGQELHTELVGVSPDVMTWNNIILGFAEQGDCLQAYLLYQQMKEQAVLPNLVTFTNSLKACGSTAALNVGRRITAHIYGKAGSSEVEILLENAIVDMYGRCGSLAEAQQTFNAMPSRQLVTWNGLVTGYSRQGKSDAVFSLVSRMRDEGFQPNEVTLLGVLNACNHAGLVDKGKDYFNAMNLEYHLDGNIMHHNCVIDLLSRAGRFDEVWAWLQEMPIQPNLDSWITVLNACQTWGNVELGRYAFESLVKLDRSNKGAFIMMGNIYANANMWDEARKSSIVIIGEEAL